MNVGRAIIILVVACLTIIWVASKRAVQSAPHRHVIVFNDGSSTATVATDRQAIANMIEMIGSGSSRAEAQVTAARVDGRVFDVPNGTRAEVLEDADVSTTHVRLSLLRIRLLSGTRAGSEALCFSSVTQPEK